MAKVEISLPQAAQRLHLRWRDAWDLILVGGIEGEYRGGRWYIDANSVDRVAAQRKVELISA